MTLCGREVKEGKGGKRGKGGKGGRICFLVVGQRQGFAQLPSNYSKLFSSRNI